MLIKLSNVFKLFDVLCNLILSEKRRLICRESSERTPYRKAARVRAHKMICAACSIGFLAVFLHFCCLRRQDAKSERLPLVAIFVVKFSQRLRVSASLLFINAILFVGKMTDQVWTFERISNDEVYIKWKFVEKRLSTWDKWDDEPLHSPDFQVELDGHEVRIVIYAERACIQLVSDDFPIHIAAAVWWTDSIGNTYKKPLGKCF